jgi:hypothetical protein
MHSFKFNQQDAMLYNIYNIPDAVCTVWAPDDGRKTAWNM